MCLILAKPLLLTTYRYDSNVNLLTANQLFFTSTSYIMHLDVIGEPVKAALVCTSVKYPITIKKT